jgi:pimeloyl-ACP methyl ester carboxylesterase
MTVPSTEETRYARNGEVRIAFEDLGGAGGEPLLLIMGLAVSRFWWPPGLVDELARMRFPEGHDGDIALAVAATRAIASPAYPFDEQDVRRMAERDQVSGVRDTAAQSRQAGAKWHGGRLSQLRVPTLVLHGAQDPLLRPAAARRTAAAISGARLVILPGVGHYLPAAVYPQVADEVRALADRAAPAAPKSGSAG